MGVNLRSLINKTSEQNVAADLTDDNADDLVAKQKPEKSAIDKKIDEIAAAAQQEVDKKAISSLEAKAAEIKMPADSANEPSDAPVVMLDLPEGNAKVDTVATESPKTEEQPFAVINIAGTTSVPTTPANAVDSVAELADNTGPLADATEKEKRAAEALAKIAEKKMSGDELEQALTEWYVMYADCYDTEIVRKSAQKQHFKEKLASIDEKMKAHALKVSEAINGPDNASVDSPAGAPAGGAGRGQPGGRQNLSDAVSSAGHSAADVVEHLVDGAVNFLGAAAGYLGGAVAGLGKSVAKNGVAAFKRGAERKFSENQGAERLCYDASFESMENVKREGGELLASLSKNGIDVNTFGANFLKSVVHLPVESQEEVLGQFCKYSEAVLGLESNVDEATFSAEKIKDKLEVNSQKDLLARYTHLKGALKAMSPDIKGLPVSEELVGIIKGRKEVGDFNEESITDALTDAEAQNPGAIEDAVKRTKKTETKLDGLMDFVNKAIAKIMALFTKSDSDNEKTAAASQANMP